MTELVDVINWRTVRHSLNINAVIADKSGSAMVSVPGEAMSMVEVNDTYANDVTCSMTDDADNSTFTESSMSDVMLKIPDPVVDLGAGVPWPVLVTSLENVMNKKSKRILDDLSAVGTDDNGSSAFALYGKMITCALIIDGGNKIVWREAIATGAKDCNHDLVDDHHKTTHPFANTIAKDENGQDMEQIRSDCNSGVKGTVVVLNDYMVPGLSPQRLCKVDGYEKIKRILVMVGLPANVSVLSNIFIVDCWELGWEGPTLINKEFYDRVCDDMLNWDGSRGGCPEDKMHVVLSDVVMQDNNFRFLGHCALMANEPTETVKVAIGSEMTAHGDILHKAIDSVVAPV